MVLRRLLLCFAASLLVVSTAVAVDLEKGKEINGTCAACHGDQGAGGKKGEYPRLACKVALVVNLLQMHFCSKSHIQMLELLI